MKGAGASLAASAMPADDAGMFPDPSMKHTLMQVQPAAPADLHAIRAAYDAGRKMQREQRSVVWPEFTDNAILAEIEAGRLLRVMDGDTLAGVFSVAYEDSAIWGEMERGAHIYLHRITRSADYRGRGLVSAVLEWAAVRCTELGRAGLRMDTWASNEALLKYYGHLGFQLVGRRRIAPDTRLAAHYHGIELALLEKPCRAEVEPTSIAGVRVD